MRNFILILFCVGLCGSVFAQDIPQVDIIGTWKHAKEGLTFQFNADGTFTMGEESAAARRTIEQEQRKRGEKVITSVSGTYTATENKIEMLMLVDEKTHKVRMTYKLMDTNVLHMEGQDYRRVNLTSSL